MSQEETQKVVLVGRAGVGKTCIINRFTKDEFEAEYVSSFTAQFTRKIMEFSDGRRIIFDIWDTAGQEKYRALAKMYYKNARVVILVYDITESESFTELKDYWYEQVKQVDTENFIMAVAANKSDLYEEKQVEENEGEEFAKSIGAIFALTSAKNDVGITGLFDNIGRKILDSSYDFFEEEKKKKKRKMKIVKKRRKILKKKEWIFYIIMKTEKILIKHKVLEFREKPSKKLI